MAKQHDGPPPLFSSSVTSLAFLAYVDRCLARSIPSCGVSEEEEWVEPFVPKVFLRGDEGGFLSLFVAVATNHDRLFVNREVYVSLSLTNSQALLGAQLTESQQRTFLKRGLGDAALYELSRRGLRAALGYETRIENPETPSMVRMNTELSASGWVLSDKNPMPGIVSESGHNNARSCRRNDCLLFLRGHDGRDLLGEPALTKAREWLYNCLLPELTDAPFSDMNDTVRRQTQESQHDPQRDLLDKGAMPANHRSGQGNGVALNDWLTPEVLRERMKQAAQESGLHYSQIAERMGYNSSPGKNQRIAVFQFIHESKDPRLSTLLRFCDAVGLSAAELLAPPKHNK